MKSVVLEREDSLNRGGSALLLWNNAFNVLEVLGLAEKLRAMYTKLLAWEMLNPEGETLGKVEFAECKGGPHDVRVVERRALLAILAGEVTEGTIRYNSCVSGITVTDNETGITEVALQDGSTYSAKVVTGFDGTNSCVGSWMGLPKAQAVGHVVIRGIAHFSQDHKLEAKVQVFVGNGVRTAYLPMSPTMDHWFYVYRLDSSHGRRDVTSEEQVKEETLQRTSKYMGQGACITLEDALVLTQKLYGALSCLVEEPEHEVPEHERVHRALVEFNKYPFLAV